LRSKLEKLGYHVEGEKLDQVSIRVKQVLDTQRAVSDVELHEICAEVFRSTGAAVAY
jgi:isopropylmalate/homocitrate/citramalate synthase